MQALGDIPEVGQMFSTTLGMSRDGTAIVGFVHSGDQEYRVPFLWTTSQGMVQLSTHLSNHGIDFTGLSNVLPTDISDDGSVIVGTGAYSGTGVVWIARLRCPTGSPPSVQAPPLAAVECGSQGAAFTVGAEGTGVTHFRWQYQGSFAWLDLNDGSNVLEGASLEVTGSHTSQMTVRGSSHGDLFRCIVSNSCGSITSSSASVIVCRADTDCDGTIEPADIALFVNTWLASLQPPGHLGGDFDYSGTVDPADLAVFINAWLQAVAGGC